MLILRGFRAAKFRDFARTSVTEGQTLLASYTYLYFVASPVLVERPSVWELPLGLTVVIAAGTIARRADTRELRI